MADRAWDAAIESDFIVIDANFEAFGQSGVLDLFSTVFGESIRHDFNVDWEGTTSDIEVSITHGIRFSTGNGLASATDASNVELNASDGFGTDDDMNGVYFVMTSNDEEGQFRLITDSAATDNGIVLDHALSGTPSTAETYDLFRMTEHKYLIPYVALAEDTPINGGITVSWLSGQLHVVRVQYATSGTDAHRIRMSSQKDSGPG